MGRFRDSAGEDERESGIDMSALIDCVFILLIFFIVTTVFVEETGIEVDKPQAASASQLEKNSLLFALSASGQVVYGGKDVGIQGVRGIVKRTLLREKRFSYLEGQVVRKPDDGGWQFMIEAVSTFSLRRPRYSA